MVPSQKKPPCTKTLFFDNHAKKKRIEAGLYLMPKERKKKKRKTLTKWAGPLKLLPKQCVWCSKNGHQTGAIKPLSVERKRGGGARLIVGSSPRSFDSSPSDEWNLLIWSVAGTFSLFWGVHEILARKGIPWWSPALHNLRKAPESLHMTVKSWPGSVGVSQRSVRPQAMLSPPKVF